MIRRGPMSISPGRKKALVLVEALVMIGILVTLIGLLIPAVLQVREVANRSACGNNLKQIALAFQLHHDVFHVVPSNGGGIFPKLQIPGKDGNPFVPTTIEYPPPQRAVHRYGVGDPTKTPTTQTGSWAYAILPYVGQGNVYLARDWTHGVKQYACPTRRTADPQLSVNDEYGEYIGGGWVWGKTDYAANAWFVWGRPYCFRFSRVTDGLSQTILVGEKALNSRAYNTGSWYHDEPFFLGGSRGTWRGGTFIVRDQPTTTYVEHWGAAHPNGALFAFIDGSVRVLSYSTSASTMQALLTP